MPGVFAQKQQYNGGFRADKLGMTIKGESVKGLLFQNVQATFQQQITMLYELGDGNEALGSNVYYVGGRAQGSAQIGRVVGPGRLANALVEEYNDLCEPEDMNLHATGGCENSNAEGGVMYALKSAVLTTVAMSVTANDIVINENLQFMFLDMERNASI